MTIGEFSLVDCHELRLGSVEGSILSQRPCRVVMNLQAISWRHGWAEEHDDGRKQERVFVCFTLFDSPGRLKTGSKKQTGSFPVPLLSYFNNTPLSALSIKVSKDSFSLIIPTSKL